MFLKENNKTYFTKRMFHEKAPLPEAAKDHIDLSFNEYRPPVDLECIEVNELKRIVGNPQSYTVTNKAKVQNITRCNTDFAESYHDQNRIPGPVRRFIEPTFNILGQNLISEANHQRTRNYQQTQSPVHTRVAKDGGTPELTIYRITPGYFCQTMERDDRLSRKKLLIGSYEAIKEKVKNTELRIEDQDYLKYVQGPLPSLEETIPYLSRQFA